MGTKQSKMSDNIKSECQKDTDVLVGKDSCDKEKQEGVENKTKKTKSKTLRKSFKKSFSFMRKKKNKETSEDSRDIITKSNHKEESKKEKNVEGKSTKEIIEVKDVEKNKEDDVQEFTKDDKTNQYQSTGDEQKTIFREEELKFMDDESSHMSLETNIVISKYVLESIEEEIKEPEKVEH